MRLTFLDYEIDTENHEFRAGGQVRAIEPQVFDLIRYLAENPRRLVTKDELIDRLWGGRIVSDATVSACLHAGRKAVGDDGSRQEVIQTVPRRGVRFLPEVTGSAGEPAHSSDGAAADAAAGATPPGTAARSQKIRYCHGPGGARIAYATAGSGPPLMRVGHWLTHIEHDWHSPIWQPFYDEFARRHTLVRYDQRGSGLSAPDVDDLSLDAYVGEMEAVADAAGLDMFSIYASSQATPVAIEYATRHPDRLSALVLHGGFYKGRLIRSEADREQGEAYLALMRHGWAAEGSQFLQAFSSIFIPDGTPEQVASLVEMQKIATDGETAVKLRRAFDSFDVSEKLEQVTTPTLVIHARNDGVHPLQQGLDMAATIPSAELVVMESRNHVILRNDPAWKIFFEEVERFLAEHAPGGVAA